MLYNFLKFYSELESKEYAVNLRIDNKYSSPIISNP